MQIVKIRDATNWRHALRRSAAHDFYHTWDFHHISSNNNEGVPLLLVAEKNGKGIILPVLERAIADTDWLDLTTVYGYPSPLTYGEFDNSADLLGLWSALLSYLSNANYVSLFARGHPMLVPELLRGTYYKPVGDVVYLDCSLSNDEQLRKYRRNHRQNIKQLRNRGVRCLRGSSDLLLHRFRDVYERTMDSLGADGYYYFSESYYEHLINAIDFKSEVWITELDGVTLAAGLVISCGKFVQYHLSGTEPEYYKMAPSKLLIDEVRRSVTEEGGRYLVLGGGYKNLADSLLNFKKGFSDYTEKFYIARIILNKEKYEILREGRESAFFPIYRAVGVQKASSECELCEEATTSQNKE